MWQPLEPKKIICFLLQKKIRQGNLFLATILNNAVSFKSEKLDFSIEESADYQKYTLGDFLKNIEKQSVENSISIKNFTINPISH